MPKKKPPAAVSQYLATIGRKGGKKKVQKGLAAMDEERAKEIRRAGTKARWAKKERAEK